MYWMVRNENLTEECLNAAFESLGGYVNRVDRDFNRGLAYQVVRMYNNKVGTNSSEFMLHIDTFHPELRRRLERKHIKHFELRKGSKKKNLMNQTCPVRTI